MNLLRPGTAVPQSSDLALRSRVRNTVFIAGGMVFLTLFMIPVALLQGASRIAPFILAGASVICLGAIALTRIGRAGLAALIIIIVAMVGNSTLIALNPSMLSLHFFIVLAILLTTILLPPVHIWSVLIVCLLGKALTVAIFAPDWSTNKLLIEATINSSVLMAAVAAIGYLSAGGISAALGQAQAARVEVEEASRALAANNAVLETRVEERTAALRQIADEHRAAAVALQASLKAQQELNRLVAELAVPVIPISAGKLVVPLVGNIDSLRADQILTAVLTQIERTYARMVVLDVTGVAVVDTHVAAALLRVAQATRLMGAETVLAGIRPEVAQTLVGLGADLSALHAVATLQEIERLQERR